MPPGLLEPRLYRAAFAPALLAIVVLAFSLQDQARSIASELPPPSFNAQRAITIADQIVENDGSRESGSLQDDRTADLVQARLSTFGFGAARYRFDATTLNGKRTLTNVVGVRPGPSDRRLLILASRDGFDGKLERAGAYETGVLLELARVLQGRAFDHTLVLASTTGGVDGGLGAAELAKSLRRPVDGILVLRNVAAPREGAPVLTVFDSRLEPDPVFERTIEVLTAADIQGGSENRSIAAQLVRLAFPLGLGEQATFPSNGLTAAAVSPGGEPLAPPVDAPFDPVNSIGQIALRTLTTFDGSFQPTAPQAKPLAVGGKSIPQWALTLLIGTLLIPLLVAAIDGWARARRWRQSAVRGLLAPPIAFVWLLLLGLLLRGIALTGLIDAPSLPPNPLAFSATAPIVIGLVAAALALLGVVVAAASARQGTPKGGESGFALWLAAAAVVVFVINPIAAAFLVLPFHLLTLLLLTGGSSRRKVVAMTAAGMVPIAAAATYYPVVLGIPVFETVGYAVLLEAGGFVGVLALVGGCLAVAAALSAFLHLLWTAPRPGAATGLAAPFSPFR
ncbi:MAG: hypothetical protein ACPHCI_00785 [Solirubrobacterales bacterium]